MSTELVLALCCAGIAAALLVAPLGDVGIPPGPGIGRLNSGLSALVPGSGLARWTGRRSRPDVAELLGSLSGELAAGQPLSSALVSAAGGLSPVPCPKALLAAQRGGDVAEALRLDASDNGCAELRSLAACWEVASSSGSGLALAVDRLATTARAGAAARGELAAELAATRATGRLLMFLPLLGLALGQWIGADPLSWLVSSWAGRGCLVVGIGLQVAAALWLGRIVRAAAVGM